MIFADQVSIGSSVILMYAGGEDASGSPEIEGKFSSSYPSTVHVSVTDRFETRTALKPSDGFERSGPF